MKFDLSFWKNASPRRKRIYSILALFIIAFLVTIIGSLVPLSAQDAKTLSDQANQTLIQGKAHNNLAESIFVNNFSLTLLMFIPLVGPLLGLFIMFDTGLAIGAISSVQGYPGVLGLVSLLITPVFWIEYATYSLAMAESIWLFRRLQQALVYKDRQLWPKMIWRELKWTLIFLGVCAGLLAIGAVVETWLITVLG